MEEAALKTEIKKLIVAGKLDAAIELLSQYAGNDEKTDDILIHQARYNRLTKEGFSGTLSKEQIDQELNLITRHLLSFLRTEKLTITPPAEKADYLLKDFKQVFAMSVTRVKMAEVFIAAYDAMTPVTIAGIIGSSKLKSRKLVMDFLKELEKFGLLDKKKKDKSTTWILNKEGKELLEGLTTRNE